MKSETLTKLEMELTAILDCMAAGLFPPKEEERWREEIRAIEAKIQKEKERLIALKDSGEDQEYMIPKRNPARQGYAEPHTLPDMDAGDMTDNGDMETDHFGGMTDSGDDETDGGSSDDDDDDTNEEEDMFSPQARSRRLSQSDLWEE